MSLDQPFAFCFLGTEQMRLGLTVEIRHENPLPLWSDEDSPLPSMVLGLVRSRRVDPDRLRSINITQPQRGRFIRTHARVSLELNHRRDGFRHMLQHRFDLIIGYRLDRIGFTGLGPPSSQSADGLEAMVDFSGCEFVLRRPLEQSLDV
jgi:hypothetical protein